MSATWIVKTVDVFNNRQFGGSAGVPRVPPDKFSFDRFEERLDGCIVIAIAFATHGGFESMLTQSFLIVVRAILGTAIRVMDAASGWFSQGHRHVQCTDRKIAFHTVADSPANDPPRIQVQNHGQIQPALLRPDIASIDYLLAGRRCLHRREAISD